MASISDRERLFRNHEDFVSLAVELASDSNFAHSEEALRANKTVQEVAVTVHQSFRCRWEEEDGEDQEDVVRFFAALGNLSKLRSLRFVSAHYFGETYFFLKLLTETLKAAKYLELLSLHGLILVGSSPLAQDWNDWEGHTLAKVIQFHPSLKEIKLVRSCFKHTSPDALFKTLLASSMTQKLQVLHFQPSTTIDRLPTIFPSCFAGSCLKELTILNCGCDYDHLQRLADNFSSFQHLEELSLSLQGLNNKGCQAIAQILTTNSNGRLRALDLSIVDKKRNIVLDQSCASLIANALEKNSTVKRFLLSGACFPSTNLNDFVQMLRVNCVLEVFQVQLEQDLQYSNHLTDLAVEIEYMLVLNRVGRHQLLHHYHDNQEESARKQDWVDALGRVEGNLNCIYYLLAANPSLCQEYR
jgi:hypothetical protein